MKSKSSITADEKKLLEYLYEKANDIVDFCHRNNMILPVSLCLEPNFQHENKTFDYRRVDFTNYYPSGRISRIVSLSYNAYTDKAEYNDSRYEDIDDE